MNQWHLQLEADLLGCRILKWSHKIVYAYLRFRQGDNGASWPGLTTIATDLGVAKNTVIKALTELEQMGLIRAEKNPQGGRAQSNHYVTVPFAIWQEEGSQTAPFADGQKGSESALFGHARKGSESEPKSAQSLHQKGSSSAPETVQLLNENGSESEPEKNRKTKSEKKHGHFALLPTVAAVGDSAGSQPRKTPRTDTPVNGEYFERFWAGYPRKVAKQKCRAVWARLRPTADLAEQIIAAVEVYKRTEQWQRERGRFIPHPSTFLRQGRWEDEIPATAEPKRGEPDWLPDEEEAEQILQEAGVLL